MEPSQYQLVFELEETYWWHAGVRDLVVTLLARERLPSREPWILDAGCGSGMFLLTLHRRGYAHAVGVDKAPEAVALARRRRLPALARGSVESLPFPAASFDAVVSLDVLYHRGVESDVAALREFHRVLKPGGVMVLHLPAYAFLYGPHDEIAHTRRRYRRPDVRSKLEQTGFSVVRLTYRNSLLFPLALVRRLLARNVPGARPRSDVRPLPGVLNTMLGAVVRFENLLIHLGCSLPCGLSVFCVARKP